MPDLAQTLGNYDLGYLQIVADAWEIDYSAQDLQLALNILIPQLLDKARLKRMLGSLPVESHAALEDLQQEHGRMPWSLFTRRYGEVREMGPGRRDRERPDLDPVSTAEILFYRALIGRAFFETTGGGEEYAYIPDDLRLNLPGSAGSMKKPPGRAARPEEYAYIFPATGRILDDACTVLAALRMGLSEDEIPFSSYPGRYQTTVETLSSLLQAANLLDASGDPNPEAAQKFLESDRGTALSQLVESWLNSKELNELKLLPELILEGEWKNEPIRSRRAIMDLLSHVPETKWWGLEAFIGGVREQNPDFQRPAGDYDSWIIRKAGSDIYLSGFESWDQVDGQLLRFITTGYLHWLGIIELAAPDKEKDVTAFRCSDWSGALLEGKAPKDLPRDNQKLILRSDGRLIASRQVKLAVRYQVARFCEWGELKHGDYNYRITPGSLRGAGEKGLQPNHLLSLLNKHAEHVPPNIVTALERFEQDGRQARMEQVLVLRVNSPEILEELRASRAARFLGDPLGPTTVIVKSGAMEKVLSALMEMGYLGEILRKDQNEQ